MANAGPSDEDTEGSVDEDFHESSRDGALSDDASGVSEASGQSGSQDRSLVVLQGAVGGIRRVFIARFGARASFASRASPLPLPWHRAY